MECRRNSVSGYAVVGCMVVASLSLMPVCTQKVTTVPKITKCWECQNYDQAGIYYSQCPMNGTVEPDRAYLGNCTGSCFTHTDDRNKQLVVRGCTASQYGLPDPLPADGCYPWYSEIWCVCSTDGCNGVKLGVPGNKQFDSHIDYSKPTTWGPEGTGDRCRPDTGLVLMVALLLVSLLTPTHPL